MTADEVVAHLCRRPGRAGLVLDFDGTLAPIVADPTASSMGAALEPVLERLAARLAVVAIVSGRPAAFLGERAAVRGVALHGLYGLERWVDGSSVATEEAAGWRPRVEEAVAALHEAFDASEGVWVEEKGLAVGVHWRGAPDVEAAGERVAAAIERLAGATGLAREPGKLVEELRPPVDADKGSAVAGLVAVHGLEAVIYVGDDRGDLPAFAAARAAGGLAVGVDHGPDETPDELRSAVDVLVEGTDGVADLLGALATRLA